MTVDRGFATSIDIISELVALEGQVVIDVGCGDMTFSRSLVEYGARVLAVDPDAAQAALNRAAEPTANLEFIEAGAEALPIDDSSIDGVFFSFSLHHVPASLYPAVFAEVLRILKPTGYLCVIEPMDCPLNTVMKHFHDEDQVREEAQRALVKFAQPAFGSHIVYEYHSDVEYASFDAFATRFGSRTFNAGYSESDIRRPDVEAAFERAGAPDYRFSSPKKMMFLRGPRTSAS